MADPGQLEQVIMNLAINARDAMPGGGQLTIETEAAVLDDGYALSHLNVKPGRYVRLAVADTGTGIPPAVREHLFEPFFTTKAPGKGTGLGLSTVYGIVRNSGGHILVESEEGRGTRFVIYLPQAGAAEAAPSEEARPLAAGGNEAILLVEDEDGVRDLVRLVLQDAGYQVLPARNGAEALELCGRQAAPPDLLLTDLIMPQMSGVELARQMRRRFPGIKVLFMSGHTPEHLAGADFPTDARLIQKPVLPDALKEQVRLALDESTPA
jgi:CheY-like chemotaxis protein